MKIRIKSQRKSMKKKFILSIFGASLLFVACQEDTYFDEYYVDDSNSSILTETMKLIGDNYDHVTLPDLDKTLGGSTATRGRSGKKHSMSLGDEDFTFDWNNADIISSSKAEAAIVPVKQKKEMALQSVVAKGNLHREETTPLHSILYVRKFLSDGKSYAHILSFAPDRDYANACEERGEEMQLYPNPQGSNYSGILFVSTIYGEISHGIRYENGRICHYILPRSEKNRDFIERYSSEHSECHGTEHCDSTHTHTKMSMNFITINSATRSTYSTRSEYSDGGDSGGESSLRCSFCGQDVDDCMCVVIVACGVCKKQPCVCNQGTNGDDEICTKCGLPKWLCTCENIPPSPPPTPTPTPGGGGGGGTSEEEEEEENEQRPCQSDDGMSGNPLVNMYITPSTEWNINGGRFGYTRKDKYGNPKKHSGMDFTADVKTPIYATHDGVVVAVRNNHTEDTYKNRKPGDNQANLAMGNYINIETTIDGKKVTIVYWHLDSSSVNVKDVVYVGQQIGTSGKTGNAYNVTPHLHYGVKIDGEWVDPKDYLPIDYTYDSQNRLSTKLSTPCD